MSNEPNTLLVEQAIELCDDLDDESYYQELERLVNSNDLYEVQALINTMQSHLKVKIGEANNENSY
jgi:hypothetical protein